MNIPPSLSVGGQQWKVIRKPLADIDSQDNGGWNRWEKNEIWIADDIPESRQAEIFLHEILHAVNCYLSEKEVEYLASSLYQILKDNQLNFASFGDAIFL